MKESDLMRTIMLALSEAGHFVVRGNVGLFFTKDGRPISSGLPKGFSDLFGHRAGDARAFYLEVKRPGERLKPHQAAFLSAMRVRGAIAAVVTSPREALDVLR